MGEARRKRDSTESVEKIPAKFISLGDLLTGAGGLALLGVAMMLPLVGPAGALTPHYGKNMMAFSLAAMVSMAFSGMGAVFNRRGEVSHFRLSLVLFVIGALFLAALPFGFFRH